MSKNLADQPNLGYFKIIVITDSLIRMDIRSGQTWILSNKELIWKKIAEEK